MCRMNPSILTEYRTLKLRAANCDGFLEEGVASGLNEIRRAFLDAIPDPKERRTTRRLIPPLKDLDATPVHEGRRLCHQLDVLLRKRSISY